MIIVAQIPPTTPAATPAVQTASVLLMLDAMSVLAARRQHRTDGELTDSSG